jgi:hypothetical protein
MDILSFFYLPWGSVFIELSSKTIYRSLRKLLQTHAYLNKLSGSEEWQKMWGHFEINSAEGRHGSVVIGEEARRCVEQNQKTRKIGQL